MELTLDIDRLRRWIGHRESWTETLGAGPARRMQATLDRQPDAVSGMELPPFWHYLYFNPETPARDLKEDGHEKLGRFLPPVALPRRMWAGGRVRIDAPLRIGDEATKTSEIRDVSLKRGKTGALCFVTVDHRFEVDGAHRFTETQNIVYREMPAADAAPSPARPAPRDPQSSLRIVPDPVLLFRFSALIFYGHRIHYDADYARDVEGYPGLVVHGPLLAGLSAELGRNRHPDRALRQLDIRAVSPLFAPEPFFVEARDSADVTHSWARGADGALAMTVDVTFAPEPKEA